MQNVMVHTRDIKQVPVKYKKLHWDYRSRIQLKIYKYRKYTKSRSIGGGNASTIVLVLWKINFNYYLSGKRWIIWNWQMLNKFWYLRQFKKQVPLSKTNVLKSQNCAKKYMKTLFLKTFSKDESLVSLDALNGWAN